MLQALHITLLSWIHIVVNIIMIVIIITICLYYFNQVAYCFFIMWLVSFQDRSILNIKRPACLCSVDTQSAV